MNEQNLKPFAKGDARINRKGRRVGSQKQLRRLIVDIVNEPTKEGSDKTRIEEFILKLMKSENPADKALLLKYGYGNVVDELDVKVKGNVKISLAWPEDKPNE